MPLRDSRAVSYTHLSTAEEVAQIYQMLLNGGELNGKRYLSKETCRLFTTTVAIFLDIFVYRLLKADFGIHPYGRTIVSLSNTCPGCCDRYSIISNSFLAKRSSFP